MIVVVTDLGDIHILLRRTYPLLIGTGPGIDGGGVVVDILFLIILLIVLVIIMMLVLSRIIGGFGDLVLILLILFGNVVIEIGIILIYVTGFLQDFGSGLIAFILSLILMVLNSVVAELRDEILDLVGHPADLTLIHLQKRIQIHLEDVSAPFNALLGELLDQ